MTKYSVVRERSCFSYRCKDIYGESIAELQKILSRKDICAEQFAAIP